MPGEVGEIVAEGKNIARGYWQEAQETAASFRNGRLYTGDLLRWMMIASSILLTAPKASSSVAPTR